MLCKSPRWWVTQIKGTTSAPPPISCLSSLYRSNGRNTCNIRTLKRLCFRVFYHPLRLSLSSPCLSISCLYIFYSPLSLDLPLCVVIMSISVILLLRLSPHLPLPLFLSLCLLTPSLLLLSRLPSSPRFFHFIPFVLFVLPPRLYISPDLFLVLCRVEGRGRRYRLGQTRGEMG